MTPNRTAALAWGAHLLTASGIVAAFLALVAVGRGDWRGSFLWLFVAFAIDGVDGTLARRSRVAEVLPWMSGKQMDAVVDFTTYAVAPAYFFHQAELAPPGWSLPCATVMLLAAVLYYGKEGMIAEDMHFVGFPVLWNVFVFYDFFVFDPPRWVNVVCVAVLAVLHFVPMRFPYPSRSRHRRGLTLGMSAVGLLAALGVVWSHPEPHDLLRWTTVAVAVYMGLLTLETSLRRNPADDDP